jgi:CDP-glucose 4,6-dehydratase
MTINLNNNFINKKVIITGHTGFKGIWLSIWISMLGGKVYGISLPKNTNPFFFYLKNKIFQKNIKLNVENKELLIKTINSIRPDFIFHLAAQSNVLISYSDPLKTWSTNLLGTLNLLEAIKNLKKKCVIIIITSDKCYENVEQKKGYKETDRLGGSDPYSASKAGAEILISSYYRSFLIKKKNIRIATCRAGNVIGGGDFNKNRIIPDCVKSWSVKKKPLLRSPNSTRPWQHVLEPICGYIILSLKLKKEKKLNGESFNFGPNNKKNITVKDLVNKFANHWKKVSWKILKNHKQLHEATLLKLNCSKAKNLIGWKSILKISQIVRLTTDWYKLSMSNKKYLLNLTKEQILFYQSLLKKNNEKKF